MKIQVARNGEIIGTFDIEQLAQMKREHKILESDHAYISSKKEWKRIDEMPELDSAILINEKSECIPPPPPKAAAKTNCSQCGVSILQTTANETNGLCMPCSKGESPKQNNGTYSSVKNSQEIISPPQKTSAKVATMSLGLGIFGCPKSEGGTIFFDGTFRFFNSYNYDILDLEIEVYFISESELIIGYFFEKLSSIIQAGSVYKFKSNLSDNQIGQLLLSIRPGRIPNQLSRTKAECFDVRLRDGDIKSDKINLRIADEFFDKSAIAKLNDPNFDENEFTIRPKVLASFSSSKIDDKIIGALKLTVQNESIFLLEKLTISFDLLDGKKHIYTANHTFETVNANSSVQSEFKFAIPESVNASNYQCQCNVSKVRNASGGLIPFILKVGSVDYTIEEDEHSQNEKTAKSGCLTLLVLGAILFAAIILIKSCSDSGSTPESPNFKSSLNSNTQNDSSNETDNLHKYSPMVTNAFMQSCAEQGNSWGQCNCVINSFRARYSEYEFQDIIERATRGTIDESTKSWIENLNTRCSH